MPVILRQEDEIRWLAREPLTTEAILGMLAPYPAGAMEAYPVSERVNRADADDRGLIEPVKGL
jgi:putative SOS response-associated peptidase YedK